MEFDIVDLKTNKPITEAELEERIGKSDIGLEGLYINKDGLVIGLLDDGGMVSVCLEANGITIVPKITTNFKWVKQMSKDKKLETVGIHKGTRCYMCAFDEMDDCEMKCVEGRRKWLDQ